MVDAYGDASMAAAAKPRRFPWRGVMVVLLVVAAALVAVAVFLPHLLPSSVVRRQVAAMLADALGRRVTVGWARLRWDEGLTAGDVRIASRTGDGLLARAEQLTVAFRPSEAARAVAGADVPLESLRIDGLELWLVVDEAGRWNVADLAEGDPPEVGTIQIGGARVHVDNRQTGRELEFKQVNASVGELASTGNAYVNLSADLCPAPDAGAAAAAPADASADAAPSCGRVVLTANLDRLRLEPGEAPVGSVKAEWSDLPWPRLMAALVPASPLAGLLARTSGRMSAQLGPARAWSAEGAIQGARLALPATADRPAAAALPQAILGFRMHRASARAPLVVDLLNFSTPGLDVKATGTVEMASAGPATAAASGETERAAALKPGEAADAAEPPAWAVRTIDLTASGDVSWVPLCQNAAPLRPLLERFDRVGGKARFDLRVRSSEEGVRLEGSADLSDTIVVAEGRIAKTRHDRLRVDVKADGDRGLERVSPVTVHVVSDALTAHVEAAVPVRDVLRLGQADAAAEGVGPGSAARLSATEATAAVTVREASALLALVPALGARLGPVEVHGPCRVDVALRPMDAAAPGAGKGSAGKADLLSATWTTALRADLTDAAVAMPGGPNKPAGTAARLDVDAILWPTSRRSDVRTLALRLGEGRVAWDGEARVDWPRRPQEQPVGRFEGTLAIEKMAALGAVLARDRFDPTPPVAGGAVFDVVADLAEGRLRTHMQAGLAPLDLHLGDYLVKPAGQSASLALTTLWHPGRWNHVEGKADLDLPGVRLSALGQATIVAHLEQRTPPPPPAGTDDAKAAEASTVPEGPGPAAAAADGPKNTVTLTLVPKSTIEVRASVSDLARAAAISPLLETALADHQAEGGAEARAVVAFRKRGPQVTADVDLTQTALDLGRLLKKPAGAGLTARLVGDLAPNPQGWVDVNVDEAEARLADSVLRTQGRVRINLAGLAATVKPEARLAAAVAEADLTVRADWQHGPALRRALPWLAPVARRCLLDGPSHWQVSVAGTPTKGRVTLALDATDCGVRAIADTAASDGAEAGPVTVKPAGTDASVRLGVRYGEVPGEMVVEDLAVTVAEATAHASGRLMFDDPRLLVPAVPTAWALQVDGRVPDAALLASLMPGRVADLGPAGAVTVHLRAAGDAKGPEVESCRLEFDAARVRWLGRTVRLDGPVAYDYERLETEGLHLRVGGSDVRLVTYISRPNDDPTGSVIVRGTALDLSEVQEMIRRTSESLASLAEAKAKEPPEEVAGGSLADRLGERVRRLLARASLSADVQFDHVALTVPQWQTRYDLEGLEAEGRLADSRLVMPRFACRLNQGTVTGQMRLDFREDVPVLEVAYDARDLVMDKNLEPFIDTTFPGMKVFGTLSTREALTQRLAEGEHAVGHGETVLTDGVLEGPAAPDYIANLLPGLKLTRYGFNRMSNVFEKKADGDVENRMLFGGKSYDLFIFGVSHPNGETRYTLGVDLLVSLKSDVISRTLDQGKLPILHYWGRIVGSSFAEREISYVLPHEFAYDVFVRRNLLLELIRSIGEKEPEITKPPVLPREEHRPAATP